MRKLVLTVCAAACAAALAAGAPRPASAGQYQSDGSYLGAPSAVVISLFASFPNGGQGLSDAIVQLLLSNPTLVADVVYVAAKSGNLGQQVAAGVGLGKAKQALSLGGNTAAALEIGQAVQFSGNSTVQTSLAAVGTTSSLVTVPACTVPVSPSGPPC